MGLICRSVVKANLVCQAEKIALEYRMESEDVAQVASSDDANRRVFGQCRLGCIALIGHIADQA